MATPQDTRRSLAAAVKADRDREKMEAMREYQAEKLASHINMARLRALRLARESTGSQPRAAQRTTKRKAANP